MGFKNFIKELNGNRVEGELLTTIFYSLLTSFIFLILAYYLKLKTIDNIIPKYGYYLFFSALSYAIITPAIRQVRSYKEFPCMSGMMIGMTFGMIASFLTGFYIAATNGMFYGGFVGVIIGIALGVWAGKSCGVMGSMEGIMAGFMGGLMGAMTSIMLLNDHLKLAGVLVFVISSVIMIKLNYMVYNETKETERERKEDHLFTIILTFVLITITTWMIIYGPRGGIFQ
ncbi:MAG: hypothetical protein AABX19_04225 [Nanoarchaeota archaeon]